jgi:hypothetical protein
LIGDIIRASEKRGTVDREKLTRAIDRIDAQVTRGAEIVSNLNRYAHSLDQPQYALDLNQEARQAALLCQRFAQEKKQVVEVRCDDGVQQTVASPLHLQMALCRGTECCLEQLPEGGTLIIRTGRHHDRPSIEFTFDGDDGVGLAGPKEATDWPILVAVLDRLGAMVETTDPACHFRIVLPHGGDV